MMLPVSYRPPQSNPRNQQCSSDENRPALGRRYGLGSRRGIRCCSIDRHQEAIATAGNRLDKGGMVSIVFQRHSQALYRRVYAVFELDYGTVRPKMPLDLFTRNDLA